ncbi:diguanylate cyclase domain-containing protein [Microbacterium sp. NPDC057407]|uniref:bifunctional diguanylate cyclase/phosphodiesterase n=1 Tax=Microbacterium sp. NPDC057407 TaxID=3346120 RepID=UPI0036704504
MTDAHTLSADDQDDRLLGELQRARECAAEPIRTIGRIQSHGTVFGIDDVTGIVVMASEDASQWLGRDLRGAGDAQFDWALTQGLAIDPVRVEFDGGTFDMIVHRGTSPLIVELEPVIAGLDYVRTGVVGAIQRLASITDPDELRQTAAREIKRVTGYDRVMCYHFHDDGHGQVVADEREPDMEPYFGLHFPASDIPSQARALYLEKRSRVIADTDDPGLALETILDPAPEFDLGPSELRASSPHHLQFMRNMGQVSTVSFAIVSDDRLVGMFTCAHRSPRRIPVLLRRALEVLASQVASQLLAAEQIRSLRRQLEARQRRAAITAPLYGRRDAGDVLMSGERTVLDIVPADGAILRLNRVIHTVGLVPDPELVLADGNVSGHTPLITESLTADHPDLARLMPQVAGMLAVPLGPEGDCLLFFRGEVARSVDWLGDQRPSNRDQPLSPRRSFSAWREEVRGKSLPWAEHGQDAFELGEDIRVALASRAQAELAELAWRDSLTGLHNRRFLDDRLADLLRDATRAAVVFLDLDDFKIINDTHGHETGDSVLATIGKRLASVSRGTDVVARLGGDEFVIVCVGAGAEDAAAIARRAIGAIAEPIAVEGVLVGLAGSAGVVVVEPGLSASEVLSAADAAMYEAKRSGGGRVSLGGLRLGNDPQSAG